MKDRLTHAARKPVSIAGDVDVTELLATYLDVHFVSPAPVPSSWERRAPARLQKPRWSVALPGITLENWQWMYAIDIEEHSDAHWCELSDRRNWCRPCRGARFCAHRGGTRLHPPAYSGSCAGG